MRFDNMSERTVELELELKNTTADTDKAGDNSTGTVVNWCQSWSGLVKFGLGLVEPGTVINY